MDRDYHPHPQKRRASRLGPVAWDLEDLPHSPLAPYVQMNHFPGCSATRDPLRCSRRDSHNPPPASRPAGLHPLPGVHTPRLCLLLIGLETPGSTDDWTESSLIVITVSHSLKRGGLSWLLRVALRGSLGVIE